MYQISFFKFHLNFHTNYYSTLKFIILIFIIDVNIARKIYSPLILFARVFPAKYMITKVKRRSFLYKIYFNCSPKDTSFNVYKLFTPYFMSDFCITTKKICFPNMHGQFYIYFESYLIALEIHYLNLPTKVWHGDKNQECIHFVKIDAKK